MSEYTGLDINRLELFFRIKAMSIDMDLKTLDDMWDILQKFKTHNEATIAHYEHCLRVAMVAADIGKLICLPQKPLLMAGALHDIGKRELSPDCLRKTDGWTARDMREARKHADVSWKILRGRFDFTADIVVQHHRFQTDGYPKRLPPKLHGYSEVTKLLILECARIVALADVYDALHRVNDKFGEPRALSDDEIRGKMFELNPDRKELITHLYWKNILS